MSREDDDRRPPTPPDFSPLAESYARGRPRYPDELFAWLSKVVDRRGLAWDCATGNGQAALGLADRFERVVATDVSAEQLRRATPHPRIDYRLAPAERSGHAAGSVDLITVAAAAHWFDLPAFRREVERVSRPGGVLAIWTYHVGVVAPPFDALFDRLYWRVLKPYFAAETRLVDERYETLELPGEPIRAPDLAMEAAWTREQAEAFVASWSGALAYREATGAEPLAAVREEMGALWPEPAARRTLRWPLFTRISRLGEGRA